MAKMVQLIRWFLHVVRGRQKQTFLKLAVFTVTKDIGCIFPRIIECEKPQGPKY